MLEYFNNYKPGEYRTLCQHPGWRLVDTNTQIAVKEIVGYCRSVEAHKANYNNVLVRLITHLSDGIDREEDIYWRDILDRYEPICSRVGIVTSNSEGRVQRGFLYEDSYEFLVSVNKNIDFSHFNTYWKYYSPLRMIYSEDYDLDFEARERCKNINGRTVFYEIDVPKLMLMYRKWAKLRIEKERSIYPSVFLTQMVFPNMLYESSNINLFNRFISLVQYGEHFNFPKRPKNYPFYYLDSSSYIDKELRLMYKEFKNRPVKFGRFVNSLPVFDITKMKPIEMLFYLRTNVNRSNIKSSWVLWCARLPYMRYLLEFIGDRGLKYNKDLFNSFQREFLLFRSRGYRINDEVSDAFKEKLKDHIDYIQMVVLPNLK